ncbi:helix-turn-helix domain-containing protein [Acetobacter sp.]|jgi:HTH-type transcriptional regulator/antitoxin HigA|uniref:helix-turn-helix domain-containing protein n=1 Tax=Acetobacter sp. TaxID=440 RepID=UPI0025C731F0|nr:helix-turn-helix domain-containing protein [Acetobacter sp.]MCH4090724.1 helix-turn-helix domain-containing protein [Acetobacter sp.]MCI1300560.1 helix-turn-helix domain-containing protein [Acetobacter sp.]MCI1316238.1 helix-turn-helix domain-containing protein [Acetobacter sp.]
MDIKPIRNDDDLDAAIAEIGRLMELNPKHGSQDGDRLEIMTDLVSAYEDRRYPVGLPDPIDAILCRLEDKGMSRRQLCAEAGVAESRLSDALNRKRGLSMGMVRAFSRILGLPADLLVQEYPVAA